MREYINKHSGYEINTEGDSFSIAFLDVQRAVLFCLDVQHRLLETNWPPEVLQLPTCKPVRFDVSFCILFLWLMLLCLSPVVLRCVGPQYVWYRQCYA